MFCSYAWTLDEALWWYARFAFVDVQVPVCVNDGYRPKCLHTLICGAKTCIHVVAFRQ